jgi:N-acetylglutamate synthase-like GNAT family acetyltransferase
MEFQRYPETITKTDFSSKSDSLSKTLFGVDWYKYFPHKIKADVIVRVSSFNEVSNFLKVNYDQIFEVDRSIERFYSKDSSESKRRYYEACGDFFTFNQNGKIVATFVGNPIDWSSYYLRNIAVSPDYQGGGLYQGFLEHLLPVLRNHRIDRVETEVSPSNLVSVHLLNKLKFNVTGFTTSERWGAVTRMTKFLNPECEQVYLDSFCSGIRPQLWTSAGPT